MQRYQFCGSLLQLHTIKKAKLEQWVLEKRHTALQLKPLEEHIPMRPKLLCPRSWAYWNRWAPPHAEFKAVGLIWWEADTKAERPLYFPGSSNISDAVDCRRVSMARIKHTVLQKGMPQSMKGLTDQIQHFNFTLGLQLLASVNLKALESLLWEFILYCNPSLQPGSKQASFSKKKNNKFCTSILLWIVWQLVFGKERLKDVGFQSCYGKLREWKWFGCYNARVLPLQAKSVLRVMVEIWSKKRKQKIHPKPTRQTTIATHR